LDCSKNKIESMPNIPESVSGLNCLSNVFRVKILKDNKICFRGKTYQNIRYINSRI